MTIIKKFVNWLSGSTKATDMTTGRILPILISFALRIMIGNLFQQLYSMVDTAVVGRGVGAQALAAVGVTSPVTQLLLGLMIGMTSGMSVVIAQHFGSGDRGKTRKAIASGIVLIAIISAFVTVAGILLCRPLFHLIHTPDEIMDGAVLYSVMGAFGTAISTFAAQNYGKGSIDRVREGVRKCLSITILISLGLTALMFLFGPFFMQLFIDPAETAIMNSSMEYVHITSIFYVILGVNFIVRFALTGVGKTVIPMAVGISEILTRAAVTYLLVYRIGFLGMTFASPACWFTSTLLCVVCYKPMMDSARKALERRLQGLG